MEKNATRTHPLILAAAASVIVFAAVGSAALLGWLPSSHGKQEAEAVAAATSAPQTQQPVIEAPAPAPAPAQPKPVARKSEPQPAPAKVVKAVHREPVRAASKPAICTSCGVVESVREVTEAGEGTGLGAVIGGVTGGVVGRQFGGGRGKDVMTVVGAVGGGITGHQIEKRVRGTKYYEVTVRFEDGRTEVYREDAAAWNVGDRVKLVNGRLTHRV
ncbi:MAG: glycine zipper 2TM domain-containing protein [Burkholderiales bacterium]|nr:glycine zipper 2TM domain-containing protein [Burkholderiales bacterium]